MLPGMMFIRGKYGQKQSTTFNEKSKTVIKRQLSDKTWVNSHRTENKIVFLKNLNYNIYFFKLFLAILKIFLKKNVRNCCHENHSLVPKSLKTLSTTIRKFCFLSLPQQQNEDVFSIFYSCEAMKKIASNVFNLELTSWLQELTER